MARKKRGYMQIGESAPSEAETDKTVIESADDGKIPTALYARLSKADVATGKDSMENQLMILRTYAEKVPEIKVVKELVDDGFTGTNFKRPAYEELMEGVRNGNIKCIIVKDLSRLGRSYLETSDLLELELPLFGCRFISINDNIDTLYAPIDSILVGLKNLMNQKYAEDISRKIKSSFRQRAANGEFLGGKVPYGYLRDPRKKGILCIDEYASLVVRWIFQMKCDWMNDTQIVRTLDNELILPPSQYMKKLRTGRMPETYAGWRNDTIRTMTQNPVYLGHVIHGKLKRQNYLGGEKHKAKRKDWIIYESINPPIISQEMFDEARRVRTLLTGKGSCKKYAGKEYCAVPAELGRTRAGKEVRFEYR